MECLFIGFVDVAQFGFHLVEPPREKKAGHAISNHGSRPKKHLDIN